MPKIPALPPMTTADALDEIPIEDVSASTTKYITLTKLKEWFQSLAAWITPSMIDYTTLVPGNADVATDQTTTSTSYTDLATAGPAATVTVPASGRVLVLWGGGIYTTATPKYMAVAVSGANTIAAADADALRRDGSAFDTLGARSKLFTGLTPGSTTFTAKYKVASGTGNFFSRYIIAIPIP